LISDASLLAHGLARDFNNPMESRLCIKIYLQKAFDIINREFVYFIMYCIGFTNRWINWIKACIESPTFFIMLNGSPAGFLPITKVLNKVTLSHLIYL